MLVFSDTRGLVLAALGPCVLPEGGSHAF
jgi:hypothetical protein